MLNSGRNILLRGDSNKSIGFGHISRLLSLYHLISRRFEACFILIDSDNRTKKILKNRNIDFLEFNSEEQFINHKVVRESLVIVDSYKYDREAFVELANNARFLGVVNDYPGLNLSCADFVINHTPGYNRSDFTLSKNTALFTGIEYALINPSFIKTRPYRTNKVEVIFVSLGLSDSNNLLDNTVNMVAEVWKEAHIYVAAGRNQLSASVLTNPRICTEQFFITEEMIEILSKTDLTITAPSTLYMEALAAGSLVAIGCFADNHWEVYNKVLDNKGAYGLGAFDELNPKNIESIKEDIQREFRISMNLRIGSMRHKILEEIVNLWI